MSDLTETGQNGLTARFVFPAEFVGFQGHFPWRPVLPASCEIQGAVAMLETWKQRRVRLDTIVSAKFSRLVTRDEELMFSCMVTEAGDDRAEVKVSVVRGGENVAKFKLRVTFEPEAAVRR